MIPLNHILRKCKSGYKLIKSKEKINHELSAKKLKRMGNSNAHSENIQSGHRDGIWRRKLLETKLYGRNLIKGINTLAVPLVIYSGPFLKWTREELKQMDQRTRKLMTMHKALHPRDGVDRLYVSRKGGERGLAGIEDSVDASIQRFEDYIEKNRERLITATRNNTDNVRINRTKITRKWKWEDVLSDK